MGNALVPHEKGAGPGVRGMSYPSISLKTAVLRARQIWEHEHKNAAPMEALAAHWGYSPASSGLRTTVAALLSFGLVVGHGSGQNRQVQLTGRGLDIVLDTPERDKALREAILSPKLYAELLSLWDPKNLPSDHAIKVHLLRNKNFNSNSVEGFIKDFRESVGFSGLSERSIISETISESLEMQDIADVAPSISRTYSIGPIHEVAVNPNERVRLSGDLAPGVSFRLLVSGDMTSKHVKKLVKLIEIQLEDEDDSKEAK